MRKLILSTNMSLDGYLAGPGGDLDWVIADDELHDYYAAVLNRADAVLYGRVTYEIMANFWPTAPQDPSLSKSELEFAHAINRIPKIVYSKTLQNVGWKTTLMRAVVPDEILKMKQQPGNDLLIAGADLASTFIEHDLIDEYQLLVQPAVLGRGNPLFKDHRLALKLVSTQPFHSGAVLLCYQPDRK
ncbi:MAG: dihydrofolate reductase family protein [Acidobacteriota bacterium]